jgi:HK97 family phage prohead protease
MEKMQKTAKGKINLQLNETKSYKQKDDDYLDVKIKGYASTHEIDRYGEHFVSGAFSKAVNKYLSGNPVLLIDHNQGVASIAGRVNSLEEDSKGLFMEATITNAPGFRDLRHRIVEGLINAVSVSGRWTYDGKAIKDVTDLYEISLVAVPANPGALISAKSFEKDDNLKDKIILNIKK